MKLEVFEVRRHLLRPLRRDLFVRAYKPGGVASPARPLATRAVGASLPSATGSRTLEQLTVVRRAFDAEVERLEVHRAEGLDERRERIDERTLGLICDELCRGLPGASAPDPELPWLAALRPPGPAPADRAPSSLERSLEELDTVSSTLALIDRIEKLVRAQRPVLRLGLRGDVVAEVEVERTSANEVALRIVGERGPPTPAQLTELRENLRRRGLRLSALWVA